MTTGAKRKKIQAICRRFIEVCSEKICRIVSFDISERASNGILLFLGTCTMHDHWRVPSIN